MTDLNNLDEMRKLDAGKMLDITMNYHIQWQEAVKLGNAFKVPSEYKNIKNLLITGLGGSAIGGDLLSSYLSDKMRVPIFVNRNYTVPRWVNNKTLVVAVSYSGNTEETLSAFNQAVSKKAKVACLTSGGKLDEYARQNNIPVCRLSQGYPPRTALGYLFVPVLILFQKLRFVSNCTRAINETITLLSGLSRSYGPERLVENNPAKQLALKFANKVVFIIGVQDSTSVVALRWKCQLNENAEVFAVSNALPEMNHNEIVGWGGQMPDILKQIHVLFLSDSKDNPQIKRRMEITRNIMSAHACSADVISSEGQSDLARLMSLIYLGDFVSIYMAFLSNLDPTPVKLITRLKNELKEKGE